MRGFRGFAGVFIFFGVGLPFSAATAAEYRGLAVQFSKFDEPAQDKLHLDAGGRLHYRSKLQKVDVVVFDDEKKGTNLSFLLEACRRYLKSAAVEKCQPNKRINKNAAVLDCDKIATPPVVENERIEPGATAAKSLCSPYPRLDDSSATDLAPDEPGKRPDPSLQTGRLTPFWAQEEVGSPETQELLDELRKQKPLRTVKAGIIDGEFEPAVMPNLSADLKKCIKNDPKSCGLKTTMAADVDAQKKKEKGESAHATGYHGTAVSNLIGGDSPYGLSHEVEFTTLSTADTLSYAAAFDRFLTAEGDSAPEIVNMSMGVPDFYADSLAKLGKKTVLVLASGNSFPDKIDKPIRGSGAIVVGSVAPNGVMSHFSQEGDEVVITAPSHVQIQTKVPPPPGKLGGFGGTSGATPMVTGALANVQSLLPGVTTDELKLMLRGTAIPTSGTPDARDKNGAGVLNEYKLVQVAASLREGWPTNRDQLKRASAYDNTKLAADESAKAERLLSNIDDCKSLKAGLKALRRAFFLNPKDAGVRSRLAAIYREEGYLDQARFYEDPAKNESVLSIQQNKKDREFIAALARGDKAAAQNLLAQGANVNAAGGGNFRDIRPIQIVERNKDLTFQQKKDLIDFLATNGSTFDANTGIAVCNDIRSPIEKSQGAPKNGCPDTHREAAVAWTVAENYPAVLASLLNAGANPNERGPGGETALMVATDSGSKDLAKLLLDKGADVNAARPNGSTALTSAIMRGDVEMVRFLLERRADVNVSIKVEGGEVYNVLAIAADSPEITKLLKDAGAK